MPTASLLKPKLYKSTGAMAEPDVSCTLSGGRCVCGYVFFPMQFYGCEQCGRSGEALQRADLSGRGTLLASAVVHVHQGEREAPFVVGTVQLTDGPVVRTLLDRPADAPALTPGQSMQAVLKPAGQDAEGGLLLDLRFAPVQQEGGKL